ncbi:MAG: ribosome-binding factor RbfA [Pseudomonadota bacterium]|jgi:ribosome-binding factor A
MAGDYSRTQRVADYLKREVALIIQNEIRDPRVGIANITGAEVSRDLSHAKIFLTFMQAENDAEAKVAVDVLNKAAGFIRSCLASDSTMRTVPRLRFHYDSSVGHGRYMEELIQRAVGSSPSEEDGEA